MLCWMKVVDPLAKNILTPLATKASAFATDAAIQRKMRGRGVVRGEKRVTLFISNGDMDDIIRIRKSLENLCVLIDVVSKTVQQEIKRREDRFLGMLLENLVASTLGNMLTGKIIMGTGKGVVRAGRGYNNTDKQYLDYQLFQLQN